MGDMTAYLTGPNDMALIMLYLSFQYLSMGIMMLSSARRY
jgi:hypothetical protein